MDDGISIDVIDAGHDALLEFVLRCHSDVTQDGTREFRKEALDEIKPGAVLRSESKFEAVHRLIGEPRFGLP